MKRKSDVRSAHLVNTGIDRDVCELDVTRQVHDGNDKYTLCAEPPSVSLLCVYVTVPSCMRTNVCYGKEGRC